MGAIEPLFARSGMIHVTVQAGINAVGTVRTIKRRDRRCFTGGATWLVDAGKNVITGLMNGIGSAFRLA